MQFIKSVFEVLGFKVAPKEYQSRFEARIPVVKNDDDFFKRKARESYMLREYKPEDIPISFGPNLFSKFIDRADLMSFDDCKEFARKVSSNKYVSVKKDLISPQLDELINLSINKDLVDETEIRSFGVRHFKIYRPLANLLTSQAKREFAYAEINKPSGKEFDKILIEDVLKGHYGLRSIPGIYDKLQKNVDVLHVSNMKPIIFKHFNQLEEEGLVTVIGDKKDVAIVLNKEKFINVWLTSSLAQDYQNEKKERNQRYDKYISEERAKLQDKTLSGKERREVFVALKKHERTKYNLKK